MLGARIKELRESRGLTQEELAIALGLSRPAVTKYERDERIPDLITAARIAEFFGVSMDYLCGRKLSEKEKLAYEIAAILNQKGVNDINSEEFKKVMSVFSCILGVLKR